MTKYTWEHIHLRSPDPAATAQWYEDKLGAEVIRTPQPDGSTRFDLDLTGQKIFIAKADPAATGASPQTPYMGLEHIGLTVENIDAAVAELKGKGVRVHHGAEDDPAGRADRVPDGAAERVDRADPARLIPRGRAGWFRSGGSPPAARTHRGWSGCDAPAAGWSRRPRRPMPSSSGSCR